MVFQGEDIVERAETKGALAEGDVDEGGLEELVYAVWMSDILDKRMIYPICPPVVRATPLPEILVQKGQRGPVAALDLDGRVVRDVQVVGRLEEQFFGAGDEVDVGEWMWVWLWFWANWGHGFWEVEWAG